MSTHKLEFWNVLGDKDHFDAGNFDWIEFDPAEDGRRAQLRAGTGKGPETVSGNDKIVAEQGGVMNQWWPTGAGGLVGYSEMSFLPIAELRQDLLECGHPRECLNHHETECMWCMKVRLTNQAYKERDEARSEASDERAARRVQAKEFETELNAARAEGYATRKGEEKSAFNLIRGILEDM